MSSLIGTGIDLVEVERLKRAVSRYGQRFLSRVYTEQELSYCRERRFLYEHLAGRFAAKEAVRKAFGPHTSGLRWQEVEVENDNAGKPVIHLTGEAYRLAFTLRLKEILITVSHSRRFAVAQVILLRE